MIVKKFDSQQDWLDFRKGKIGGSSAFDVYSVKEPTVDDIKKVLDAGKIEYKKSAPKSELKSLVPVELANQLEDRVEKKMGYYELMAKRLAVPEEATDTEETPPERGIRLEEEALSVFSEKTAKTVVNDEVIWISDIHPSITYSPDGVISDEEVAEAKCLSSALHLYIYFEKDIPVEYKRQNIQAFIVNEKLQTLHFVCYDPRIPSLPMHYITIKREEIADEIKKHTEYQVQVLRMLESDIITLTF
jgi:hypothetical protein